MGLKMSFVYIEGIPTYLLLPIQSSSLFHQHLSQMYCLELGMAQAIPLIRLLFAFVPGLGVVGVRRAMLLVGGGMRGRHRTSSLWFCQRMIWQCSCNLTVPPLRILAMPVKESRSIQSISLFFEAFDRTFHNVLSLAASHSTCNSQYLIRDGRVLHTAGGSINSPRGNGSLIKTV